MTETLFISDLHIDPSRPGATAAFLRFLDGEARNAGRLFILGDLFEFWIGDDDDSAVAAEVVDGLARYTAAGHECRVMRGNRDFLLGSGFESRTGVRLLPDPTVEDIFGERVLITHGDLLCTDDLKYQRYRRFVTNPVAQRVFLALPGKWRRAVGVEGRRRSRAYQAESPPEITDVNPGAVSGALGRAGVRVLVHGHTHRPGVHREDGCTRIVLGAWYEQGSVLRWSASGFHLGTLPFG